MPVESMSREDGSGIGVSDDVMSKVKSEEKVFGPKLRRLNVPRENVGAASDPVKSCGPD